MPLRDARVTEMDAPRTEPRPAARPASARLLTYGAQSAPRLTALAGRQLVAFWSVSPLEVHGPHLPLGTDIDLAEAVLERTALGWLERHPQSYALRLPPLALGADVLPLPGSLELRPRTLRHVIQQVGLGLGRLGVSALLLANNHGGPRHMLAMEQAGRWLRRKHGLLVVNPFPYFLHVMHRRDVTLLRRAGLDPAAGIGGEMDLHAGALETSMALCALAPQSIDADYAALPPVSLAGESRLGRLLRRLDGLCHAAPRPLGAAASQLGQRARYLADLFDWLALDPMPSYVGAPALADPVLGQRVLQTLAEASVDLLERGMNGEDLDPVTRPPLWALRAITGLVR